MTDDDIKRVREATGLGLREVRERLERLILDGYPPRAAVEALVAAGPTV